MSEFEELVAPHAYATVMHVERLNQGRRAFPATGPQGTITDVDVVDWLVETAGVIDGLLRQKGYSAPVPAGAATTALKTLEGLNALGAAYYVERSAKTSDRLEDARAMWESAQKMLKDGVIELDLPIDLEESLPRGGFGSAGPAATPFFTREMVL